MSIVAENTSNIPVVFEFPPKLRISPLCHFGDKMSNYRENGSFKTKNDEKSVFFGIFETFYGKRGTKRGKNGRAQKVPFSVSSSEQRARQHPDISAAVNLVPVL